MSIRKSILVRVRLAFLSVVFVASAIVVKMIDIQIVNGDKWKSIARENTLRFAKVEATRGSILSDNTSLLATSIPSFIVSFDPTVASEEVFSSNVDSLALMLSTFFEEKDSTQFAEDLRVARATNNQYIRLARRYVSYQEMKKMRRWPILREGRSKGGIIFEKKEKRLRPFEPLARRTVGYIWEDTSGQMNGRGLEYSFNKNLAGVNGEAIYQRVSGGRWKPLNDGSQIRPENGSDIKTTIDIDIQNYATKVLNDALIYNNADYGSVVLMEVATGKVKAMVNLGKGDEGRYLEDYNYAVGSQGVTEPGSTFKAVSMMAILEEGNVLVTDTVNTGNGEYMFYEECVMRDAALWGYGRISVQDVFEKSSNIGISKLVFRHFREKPERFIKYIEKFGLTKPLGFQMAGEGKPLIWAPSDQAWSGCSLPWMSIGYELKISPIHLLTFYNGIANNGRMVKPLIVSEILSGNQIVQSFPTEVVNEKLCSDRTLTILHAMLEGVVERGTATDIYTTKYKIAGKTGTTHKVKDGKYTSDYYCSFVGYFPADKPRYSCIVVIDNPSGKEHYGGKVAAPVFRRISDKVFSKYIRKPVSELPQDTTVTFPFISSGNFKDLTLLSDEFGLKHVPLNTKMWVKTRTAGDTIQWVDNIYTGEKIVADVRGMTLRDALYVLENQGLRVKVYGAGRVRRQSVSPGTRLVGGRGIVISLE